MQKQKILDNEKVKGASMEYDKQQNKYKQGPNISLASLGKASVLTGEGTGKMRKERKRNSLKNSGSVMAEDEDVTNTLQGITTLVRELEEKHGEIDETQKALDKRIERLRKKLVMALSNHPLPEEAGH